tara:strand:+ start:257 stop:925 length:669 start_codon:yes stop_codon:yes gene_type:complete
MNWIRILKNKIMGDQQKKQDSQFFVWVKSERVGQVVEVDGSTNDNKWLKFTDGTQCNRSLVSEFLLPANSQDQANIIAKDFGGLVIPNETESARPVRPRRDQDTESARPVRPRRDPEAEQVVDVMREMLKRMSTKNKANMPVQINIPSKAIYDLLKDQMDITKKDLNGQIAALVEDQIDNLREQLKEQIESFITNYYTNVRTNTSTRGNNTSSTESESTDSE